MLRWIALTTCGLALVLGRALAQPVAEHALADYVAKGDPSFAWREAGRYEVPGAELIEIELHSQTWQGVLWKHQLVLVRPRTAAGAALPVSQQGLLVVGGGRWRDTRDPDFERKLREDSRLFVEMAKRLSAVVAVLGQVPFQPMFDLTEDQLIAYTFERYLETGDAEWPLLLPMVKSVIRAMDATQAVASRDWDLSIDRFTVLGGSKRGWTTWLVGAVEPRAAALVPTVIDAVNFAAHMPYQSAIWGRPSAKLAPYTQRDLVEILGSDSGRSLRAIVDPYSYRAALVQPKLIVVATNDAYFPVDSLNLYWDALVAPKYVLYLPNDEHSIDDFGRLIPALAAFHRAASGSAAMPALEWEFESLPQALRLCVRATPSPETVVAWSALARDAGFVDARFMPALVAEHDGVYVYESAVPPSGYTALFAEVLFAGAPSRFALSTNLRVSDSAGAAPSAATAIRGTPGICPR